jgi:hypothetical protein
MRHSKAVGRSLGIAGRAALASLGAGLAVGAAAPLASAAAIPDSPRAAQPGAAPARFDASDAADWSSLGDFKLYPLAGTGIDPLSNVVGTEVGGVPVSTAPISAMASDGVPVNDLPVIGSLFGPSQE